jgi:2-keto-4-pentenoate hydratase
VSEALPGQPSGEPDVRITEGMRAQAGLLHTIRASGSRRIGWKAGFGTVQWRERFELSAPLVGFLHDAATLPSGGTVDLTGWTAPKAETELAVTIGHAVDGARLAPGPAGDATLREAIAGIAPAIELIDLHPAPEEVTAILAGNVYHRHVVLGPPDTTRAGGALDGLAGHVELRGEEVARVTDLEAATGPVLTVLREVARVASVHADGLAAGDVVILGSIVPPMAVAAGDTLRYRLGTSPTLELHFG